MLSDEMLLKLSDVLGFARGYHDIWGRWTDTSSESIRLLLKSMHLSFSNDAEANAYLEAQQQKRDREFLPCVLVLRRWQREVNLRNPAPSDLTAEVQCEDGRILIAQVRGQTVFLQDEVPLGYHTLKLGRENNIVTRCPLIVVPERCYGPADAEDTGRWGISLQLYSLESERPYGMGDFSDLRRFIQALKGTNVSFVGLNPLHALAFRDPLGFSPYSPTSRSLLNLLYIDPFSTEEARHLGTESTPQHGTNSEELIDYPQVARDKFEIFERLYRIFREHHGKCRTKRAKVFKKYVSQRGDELHRWALYEALSEHFSKTDIQKVHSVTWPEEFRNVQSEQVKQFASEHAERIDFYKYLQWQAEEQLALASAEARELGIGLYLDLAVGVSGGSAAVWSDPSLYAVGASAGAPPDLLNVQGQVWGLPPFIPEELQRRAYEPFVEMLRFNMQYAGALRIDHIMSLMRLFWVPDGKSGSNGVYMGYPFEDLLGIVCLESQRQRCIVVGEDLGTVPNEVRAGMERCGILSYKVLYFMKNYDGDGKFFAPESYPKTALVTASTHDLPTLCGFWEGVDLEVRKQLDLFSETCTYEGEREGRNRDRDSLKELFRSNGIISNEGDLSAEQFALAAQVFLRRTSSALCCVQVEDLLLQKMQVNLPGTITEHPNWRRRYNVPVEKIVRALSNL